MKKSILFFAGLSLLVSACNNPPAPTNGGEQETAITQADQDLLATAKTFFQPMPSEALNPENPLTEPKIKLGKMLYFEKNLSVKSTQSCNTCHNLSAFGVDNLPTSPGDNGIPGTRNSPTTFNSALRTAQFWDGRNKDVEEQAGGPVMNPAEMGMPDKKVVEERLNTMGNYKALFAEAFPEVAEPVSFENMQKAIGAFERTLLTPARFDQYLAGDVNALSADERTGLKSFIDNGCTACHMGSLLGGNMMMKVGLFGDYNQMMKAVTPDYGLYEQTKAEADKGMFFTPGLRNVEKTGPYFHNGGISSLPEAIKIIAKLQLNKDLTDAEAQSMATFFNSLTGDIPEDVKKDPFAGL